MSRQPKLSLTPMAVASDGTLIVNLGYVSTSTDVTEMLASLPNTATLLVGLVVPRRRRASLLKKLDDAAAAIAATTTITSRGAKSSLASFPSGAPAASTHQDRPARQTRRQRDRRRGP